MDYLDALIKKQWADARYDREEALERIRAEKAKCACDFANYCPNCW